MVSFLLLLSDVGKYECYNQRGSARVYFNWFPSPLWQKLYKENYEKTKAKSINYCETPKFQLDTILHNFSSDVSNHTATRSL